jgi:hypothetical protein
MFEHDSILGGLNLLQKHTRPFKAYRNDRPPYPVINQNPSMAQVFGNLNQADVGIFGFAYLLGIPLANRVANKTAQSYGQKIVVFGLAHGYMYLMGGVLALGNS